MLKNLWIVKHKNIIVYSYQHWVGRNSVGSTVKASYLCTLACP